MKLFSVNSMFLIFHSPEQTWEASCTPPPVWCDSSWTSPSLSLSPVWRSAWQHSVPAVPSPALHNRIIWRKYPGLNTKCPISKEGKGDWIGRKTELDKDTAISITNTDNSSEAIGQNKDYIHPQLVWVQAPHLKMSSEVYKWCRGGGGWVAAALLFLNNF